MNSSQATDLFRVDQIDHVEVFVPDRYKAAQWYQRVLGLTIIEKYEHWAADEGGPLMISSDGGHTKLALFEGEPQGSKPTAGFHRLAFRVGAADFVKFIDKLDDLELVNHLQQPLTASHVVDHRAAFSMYFCDPFGHRLELTTYEYESVSSVLSRRGNA